MQDVNLIEIFLNDDLNIAKALRYNNRISLKINTRLENRFASVIWNICITQKQVYKLQKDVAKIKFMCIMWNNVTL